MTPEILHTLSIIATVVGSAYYIHRDMKADIKTQNENIDRQSARTDRLYEMYCETQKDYNQKFYDLLKDRK